MRRGASVEVVDEQPLSVGPGVAVVQVSPAAGGIDGQLLVRGEEVRPAR